MLLDPLTRCRCRRRHHRRRGPSAGLFYTDPVAQKLWADHVTFLTSHVNPYTGVAHNRDPTILAWQIANEPRMRHVRMFSCHQHRCGHRPPVVRLGRRENGYSGGARRRRREVTTVPPTPAGRLGGAGGRLQGLRRQRKRHHQGGGAEAARVHGHGGRHGLVFEGASDTPHAAGLEDRLCDGAPRKIFAAIAYIPPAFTGKHRE